MSNETKTAALRQCMDSICDEVRHISGWMSTRELRFLVWLAAHPTTRGDILELGSYEGKSTIALGKGSAISDRALITTVDVRPSQRLERNLSRAGIRARCDIQQAHSVEFAKQWRRPIRLLWHDGANDDTTVREDLRRLIPYLNDGAIVAMHDVLNHSGERIQSFCRDILLSGSFGTAGIVGSIGWAQRTDDKERIQETAKERERLAAKLRPLVRFHNFHGPVRFRDKMVYKLHRARVPHAEPEYDQLLRAMA